MQHQKYDRFKDAPWFSEEKAPILIGGAGGIGSWLAVFATRAGFECHVFDDDTLEAINMAGQLFFHSDIGKPKVDALANVVRATCDEELFVYNQKVDAYTMTNNIVFTAFDNITARRHMFESWVKDFRGAADAVFIDGRLMAEQLTIFIIRADDEEAIQDYLNKHLPDDSTIADAPCTFKQVSHNAGMIASKMVAYLTNFMTGVRSDDKSRATPYKTEEMTALDYRKQNYRPAKAPPVVDLNFEGQGNTIPSKVELEDVVAPEEVMEAPVQYYEPLRDAEFVQIPAEELILGTAGEMEANEDLAEAFFTPLSAPVASTPSPSIPFPDRFAIPSVALRDLVRAKNLRTFPLWLQVSSYTSRQMLDEFGEDLLFSEREWLRRNPDMVFATSDNVPYHGIHDLMQFLPHITVIADGANTRYRMEQYEFERMIRIISNRMPENRDEAVRLAAARNITLNEELPF